MIGFKSHMNIFNCVDRPRQYELHPSIRETQSDPVSSPRLRRPNNLVNRVRRFSHSLYHAGVGGFNGFVEENPSETDSFNHLTVLEEVVADDKDLK